MQSSGNEITQILLMSVGKVAQTSSINLNTQMNKGRCHLLTGECILVGVPLTKPMATYSEFFPPLKKPAGLQGQNKILTLVNHLQGQIRKTLPLFSFSQTVTLNAE